MNEQALTAAMQELGEQVGKRVNNYETIKTECKKTCGDLMSACREGVNFHAAYPYVFNDRVNITDISYMAEDNCIWGDGYMVSDYLDDAKSFVRLRNQERAKGRTEALTQIRAELGGLKLYRRNGSKFARYDI
jgi:hypothetical protein